MKRHKWVPLADFPARDDLRVCANKGCGMHRRDFSPERWEYRNQEYRIIEVRKKSWSQPPCPGPSKETNT